MRCPLCAAVVIGLAGIVQAAEPGTLRHEPTATCLTPAPARVVLRGPEIDVRAVLAAWEAAAADTEPIGKSERQRIQYTLRDRHSAHELALVSELSGPIRADELWQRYEWTTASRAGGVSRLNARPRETAEALFIPQFTLEFDDRSRLPVAIEFSGGTAPRSSAPLTAARIELTPGTRFAVSAPAEEHTVIQTVSHATAESEAERILGRWAESISSAPTFEVSFERITYDHVFEVEKRATGSLTVRPDVVRYEVRAATEPENRPSGRTNRHGQHYKLQADRPETWEIRGNRIRFVDASGQVQESIGRAEASESWFNIGALIPTADDLLPPIVPVSGEKPLGDCSVELLSSRDSRTVLKLTPKSKRAKAHFREMQVILGTDDRRPKAVRTFDPSGNLETVHLLSDWRPVRDELHRFVPPPPAARR